MALLGYGLVSDICAYLEFMDVVHLELTSKEIADGLVNSKEQPVAWLTVAKYAGLSVDSVNKTSIKMLCTALLSFNSSDKISVNNSQLADQITKAMRHMKKIKLRRECVGRKFSQSFITHLRFHPADVQEYRCDPENTEVSSIPFQIAVGEQTAQISFHFMGDSVVLGWDKEIAPFEPVGMHVRTVGSPLIMRTSFMISKPQEHYHDNGLCCMLQDVSDFAQSMTEGILIVGVVHSLFVTSGMHETKASLANALSLDAWHFE